MLTCMDSLQYVAAPSKPSRRTRATKATVAPEIAPVCQPLPPWAQTAARPGAGAENFAAGAVLLAIDRLNRADPAWLGVLRARQALRAAAASARQLRHREDEAGLRDAHHLTRPNDDPGPVEDFIACGGSFRRDRRVSLAPAWPRSPRRLASARSPALSTA